MKLGPIASLLIAIPIGVACGSDNANRVSWNNAQPQQNQQWETRIQFHGAGGSSQPYRSTPPLFGQIDSPTAVDTLLTVYYVDSLSDSMAVNAVEALTSQYPDFRQRQQKANSQVTVQGVAFRKIERVSVAADGSFYIRPVNDYQDPGVTWLVIVDTKERVAGVRDVRR